ncbi:response regulator [Mastigocladopsis repens]|uniref:response regulator n=1 Tax=Mastigocladopsis repens TaxID=221287 RepID=UPI000303DECA|nr:response regulator [Mastigocladopsis repens]
MQPGFPSFANIAERLAILSQQRATGELILSSGDNQWHLYLFLGRVLYATGGVHRVRRWHRAVTQDCPDLKFDAALLKEDELWEYRLLEQGLSQNQLTLTQAKSIISKIVHEVLFTLVRHSDSRSLWLPKKLHPIALIDIRQSLQASVDLWKQWQKIGLRELCPDMAPIFKQPNCEQNLTTSKTFFSLSQLVNGENTIWDIALQMRQSVTTIATVIQNLANEGVLELLTVPDLPDPAPPVPISSPSTPKHIQPSDALMGDTTLTASSQHLPNLTKTHPRHSLQLREVEEYNFVDSVQATQPLSTFDSPSVNLVQPEATGSLIAYIDDSYSDRVTMDHILTQAGYEFLNIQDPVTALPILLEQKPSLIFLDLVMPIANGYEICSQIRRVSAFKNTPVIILTSNDGIVDRVRAKMVGSSGFLAKPITPDKVLKILQRHLPSLTPVKVESLKTVEV